MKKGVLISIIFAFVLISLFLQLISATTNPFSDEIKKVAYYATEYEAGNINYAQFYVKSSAASSKIDEILGLGFQNGVSEQDQLKAAFGEADDQTDNIYGNYNIQIKLNESMPIWNKIIFDGEKIQITFNANPNYDSYNKKIIYRPNFNINFKTASINLDSKNKLNEITASTQQFSNNPNQENTNKLGVSAGTFEKNFRDYFNQNPQNCENLMKDIFGSENEGEIQKVIVDQYNLATNDKNDNLFLILERCDDCTVPRINLNIKLGLNGDYNLKSDNSDKNYDYNGQSMDYLMDETKKTLEEYKRLFSEKDYQGAIQNDEKLKRLQEALNMQNWKGDNEEIKAKVEQIMQSQNVFRDYFYGIKFEVERQKLVKQMQKDNYDKIKKFYLDYLSSYPKTETYYTQINFKKILFNEVKSMGDEICNNNIDDNNDGKIDCEDPQCQGKICGIDNSGNETINLFCIENTCQTRKELVLEKPVCGNGICEPDERGNCLKDCPICPEQPELNCSGKVIFSEKDSNDCPINPICILENNHCEIDSDCTQPLCGQAKCILNICKTTGLELCKDAQCIEGDEKTQDCNSKQLVTQKCIDGIWKETGVKCDNPTTNSNESDNNENNKVFGEECNVKSDCNREDYICSNGKCVIVPKNSNNHDNNQQITQPNLGDNANSNEQKDDSNLQNNDNKTISGNVIFNFFTSLIKLTGYDIADGNSDNNSINPNDNSPNPDNSNESQKSNDNSNQNSDQNNPGQNNPNDQNNNLQNPDKTKNDGQNKPQDDSKFNDCKASCEGECDNEVLVPCVNTCVFNKEGKTQGDYDDCKKTCSDSNDNQRKDCINSCYDSCKNDPSYRKNTNSKDNKDKMIEFSLTGSCQIYNKSSKIFNNNADIRFQIDGGNFDNLNKLMEQYNSWDGGIEWHKTEYNRLLKERMELEAGLTPEFAKWYFETYLPNSAEDWEGASQGLYDLYNLDVKNIQENMRHVSYVNSDFSLYHLININYSTDYGEIELWEEWTKMKVPGSDVEIEVPTPYMKSWIFPSRDFIENGFNHMMINHEFPGAAKDRVERGQSQGLTDEEKMNLKNDSEFMKTIKKITDKYNGNLNGDVEVKDLKIDKTVFNVFINVNQDDIFKMQPMPPTEAPKEDIKVVLDFDKIYNLVYTTQKESEQTKIMSPEWGKKPDFGAQVNQIVNGIKIFLEVNSIIDSAEITPKSARSDVNSLVKAFIWEMMKNNGDNNNNNNQDNQNKTLSDDSKSMDKNK